MNQDKKNEILNRYQELPEDLQRALVSPNYSDIMTEIGKKFELPIDKVGELADETGLVMLGLTSPSDYVKNLTARLSVPQEKARAIAEEINQKVFQPVRESLKKIHGVVPGAKKPEAPPIPIPKPLPKREDIVAPLIPPIFVKKMPEPIAPPPDIIPPPKESAPQNSLAAKNALDKELSVPPPSQPSQYKEKDPYREIIE